MNFKILIVLFGLISFVVKSQDLEVGVGLAPEYNFQTNSIAIQAKTMAYYDRYGLNLKYSYYPSSISNTSMLNNIQERCISLGFQYMLTYERKYHVYALADLVYNQWMNHSDQSAMFNVEDRNIYPQFGVGLMGTYGCFRPYADFTYNTFWKEGSARLGVVWFPFNCTKPKDRSCPTF